ncbi:hypothetical protein [Enemella evansiae]|uniref:hypothetical protein n=1 Tax=Enemella evansiae TaxID=2016499 RepID=UPI0015550C94|nr:hypothetical protein [Enemella evansiae]
MGAAKVPLKGFIKKYVDDLLRVTEDRAARYADNVAARNGPQISRSAELRFRPGGRLRERMQRNPALRDEYRRHLAMQERGLNAMSVDEFLRTGGTSGTSGVAAVGRSESHESGCSMRPQTTSWLRCGAEHRAAFHPQTWNACEARRVRSRTMS